MAASLSGYDAFLLRRVGLDRHVAVLGRMDAQFRIQWEQWRWRQYLADRRLAEGAQDDPATSGPGAVDQGLIL